MLCVYFFWCMFFFGAGCELNGARCAQFCPYSRALSLGAEVTVKSR